MSRSSQKLVDAGIKQLVGHIIPKARHQEDAEFVQETVDEHIELVHAILNEYLLPMRAMSLDPWALLTLAVTATRPLPSPPTRTMLTT